jgi:hypothetical protein
MQTPVERLLGEVPNYTFSRFLGVRVGHIFVHTTNTNLSLDLKNVFFLATVHYTKVINVSMFLPIDYIFLVM